MLKKSILALAPLFLLAFEDLGIHGNVYDVEEKTLKQTFEPIYEKNKAKFKPMIIKAYNQAFTKYSTLPNSTKDANTTSIDYSIVPYDIVNPYNHNELIYRKGDKIAVPLPQGVKKSFCVIDGSRNKKIVDKVISELGKCSFYLVANIDIRKFIKKYHFKKEIYPYNEALIKRFQVTSLPHKVILFGKYRVNKTLNYYRIRKEVEKEKSLGEK